MDIKQYNRKLIKWVKNHYWDSLETEKDLILRHFRTFTGDEATTDGTAGLLKEILKEQDVAYNIYLDDNKAMAVSTNDIKRILSHVKI